MAGLVSCVLFSFVVSKPFQITCDVFQFYCYPVRKVESEQIVAFPHRQTFIILLLQRNLDKENLSNGKSQQRRNLGTKNCEKKKSLQREILTKDQCRIIKSDLLSFHETPDCCAERTQIRCRILLFNSFLSNLSPTIPLMTVNDTNCLPAVQHTIIKSDPIAFDVPPD